MIKNIFKINYNLKNKNMIHQNENLEFMKKILQSFSFYLFINLQNTESVIQLISKKWNY